MLSILLRNRFSLKLPVGLSRISTGSFKSAKKVISRRNRAVYDPIYMEEYSELFSRVTVVEDVEQSERIVKRILDVGQPVAVDMEGVVSGVTSMVQICDSERNISLFRTGFNPRLYWEGGLARVLESPYIMKIMHAATGDCLSAYKDGVRLWNLYDTCIAHRVLEYQINGRSMYSSPQIGFNDLCNYCGLPENKMKERFQDIFWKMIVTRNGTNGLNTAKTLSEEVILYCALDVEPLHEIHNILSSLTAPDYSHFVSELSEVEIIRAINPDLAKRKRKSLQNMESCNLFLTQLHPSTSKPELYSQLGSVEGLTHIYHSDIHNSANILLESRAAAETAAQLLEDQLEVRLLHKVETTELVEDQGQTDDHVTETEVVTDLVDRLISAGSPVVADFHLFPTCSTIELYFGQSPSVKILLTGEILTDGGLGRLLSSNQVVKIVFRLDVSSVHTALNICSQHGVELNNVFEIDLAVKILDYAELGRSIFRAQSKSIQSVVSSLGLGGQGSGRGFRLDWYYISYLHLNSVMGSHLKSLLTERVEIELTNKENSSTVKEKRKLLRKKLEECCVHIRPLDGSVDKVKSLVLRTLLARDLLLVEYVELPSSVLVYLANKDAVSSAITELELELGEKYSVSSPHMDNVAVEKYSRPPVNIDQLVKTKDQNVARIIKKGLSK